MVKSDFTKTSRQVEREISDLIDSVGRSLDSSNGEADRKGQFVVNAILSLALFLGIFGFEHLVGRNAKAEPSHVSPNASVAIVVTKDAAANIATRLNRIDTQAAAIDSARRKIAPSMPIDAQIQIIGNSTEDLRTLLKITKP